MRTVNIWFLTGMMTVVVAGLAIVGCESTKSADNIITIYPAVAHLNSGKGAGIMFSIITAIGDASTSTSSSNSTGGTSSTTTSTTTNQTLYYPLVWSVSDPSLGVIRASEGNTAVYEVIGGEGNNIVSVHDQADNGGQAVVAQRSSY